MSLYFPSSNPSCLHATIETPKRLECVILLVTSLGLLLTGIGATLAIMGSATLPNGAVDLTSLGAIEVIGLVISIAGLGGSVLSAHFTVKLYLLGNQKESALAPSMSRLLQARAGDRAESITEARVDLESSSTEESLFSVPRLETSESSESTVLGRPRRPCDHNRQVARRFSSSLRKEFCKETTPTSPHSYEKLAALSYRRLDPVVEGEYELTSYWSAPWVDYRLKERLEDQGDVRFYISVGADPLNFKKAYEIIVPILLKRHVAEFKVLHPSELSSISGNAIGKEFIIKVGNSHDVSEEHLQKWHALFAEVGLSLKEAGIEPSNRPAQAVSVVGTAGYISTRSARNLFNQYLPVSLLKGFTKQEAARLSETAWMSMCFKSPLRLPASPVAINLSSIDFGQKEFLLEAFKNNLKENDRERYILPMLVCGEGPSYLPNPNAVTNVLRSICSGPVERLREKRLSWLLPRFQPKMTFFAPLLEKAAWVAAAIRSQRGIASEVQPGNIFPAVYDLVKLLKDKKETPLTPQEELQIIRRIVLCSLRERVDCPQEVSFDISVSQIQEILAVNS